MVVKFQVLEIYIRNCLEKGLEPTFLGLNEYVRKLNKGV